MASELKVKLQITPKQQRLAEGDDITAAHDDGEQLQCSDEIDDAMTGAEFMRLAEPIG